MPSKSMINYMTNNCIPVKTSSIHVYTCIAASENRHTPRTFVHADRKHVNAIISTPNVSNSATVQLRPFNRAINANRSIVYIVCILGPSNSRMNSSLCFCVNLTSREKSTWYSLLSMAPSRESSN